MLCVCTRRVFVSLLYWAAKQCDWLSLAVPAPFPFPLFLFPGIPISKYVPLWSLERLRSLINGNLTNYKILLAEQKIQFSAKKEWICLKRNWVFATKSNILMPISLQPCSVHLRHFKRILY